MKEDYGISSIEMPLTHIVYLFPASEEWLSDPNHTSAQLSGDNRLLSALEKFEIIQANSIRFKFIDQCIRRNSIKPPILRACREGAMTGLELMNFFDLFGKDVSVPHLYRAIVSLIGEGDTEGGLREVNDIIYIWKRDIDSNIYSVTTNLPGYETTKTGTLVYEASTKQKLGFLERLFKPIPKPAI